MAGTGQLDSSASRFRFEFGTDGVEQRAQENTVERCDVRLFKFALRAPSGAVAAIKLSR